jgi:hypothetical protein
MQVVATTRAIDIQRFAHHVQSVIPQRLHRRGVNLVNRHAALRHLGRLFLEALDLNLEPLEATGYINASSSRQRFSRIEAGLTQDRMGDYRQHHARHLLLGGAIWESLNAPNQVIRNERRARFGKQIQPDCIADLRESR